jgi:hypothetical protein
MTDISIVLISLLPFAALGLVIFLLFYIPQKTGKASLVLSTLSAMLTFLMGPIFTLSPLAIYLGFKSWRIAEDTVAQNGKTLQNWRSSVPLWLAAVVFVLQMSLLTTGYQA